MPVCPLWAQDAAADETSAAEVAPDASADVANDTAEPAPPPMPRRTFSGHSGIVRRAEPVAPPNATEVPETRAPASTSAPAGGDETPPAAPRVVQRPAAPSTPSLDEKTIITSDGGFEVHSSPEQNRFVFFDNVEIRAGDFYARCEKMEVISNRKVRDEEAAIGQLGQIESIIATGDVRITQAGRVATCKRAEIYPEKGLAYLKEDPVVIDGDTRITGYEMILDRNTETVRILPRPEGGGAGVEIPEAVTTGALPGADDAPENLDTP
ncbi:MAG: LptA/OstA family protein [Opitutales bacterium]